MKNTEKVRHWIYEIVKNSKIEEVRIPEHQPDRMHPNSFSNGRFMPLRLNVFDTKKYKWHFTFDVQMLKFLSKSTSILLITHLFRNRRKVSL
jgi:hypothetical protein